MKFFLILFSCNLLLGFNCALYAQDTIYLKNSSFEDMPRKGGEFTQPIKEWFDCGRDQFPEESPPDIHPTESRAWEVNISPYDGKTYLGLVIRYNGTFESVSQELTSHLQKDKCYSFTAFLARSDQYKSRTRRSTQNLENFISPAVLRIWGGNKFCDRAELLGQSNPVDNSIWKQYDFIFWPTEECSFIIIEAYFADNAKEDYNGHILVDDLSPIIEIECK